MKSSKIKFQDVIRINREISGKLDLFFDAPYSEERDVVIPEGTLLLFLRKNKGYDEEEKLVFDFLVNYQMELMVETYNVKPLEYERYFKKFLLSISMDDLNDSFDVILPFSYNYLTPKIDEHIYFVASEYQKDKFLKEKSLVPQSIFNKFLVEDSAFEEIKANYDKCYITFAETYRAIADLMIKQRDNS